MRPDTPLFDEDTSVQDIWDFVYSSRKSFLDNPTINEFILVMDDYQYGLLVESPQYFKLTFPYGVESDSMRLDQITGFINRILQRSLTR